MADDEAVFKGRAWSALIRVVTLACTGRAVAIWNLVVSGNASRLRLASVRLFDLFFNDSRAVF